MFFLDSNEYANLQPETLAVRAGSTRSQFGEHSEALFLTSSFVFESAAQAAARFGNTEEGPVYSRFTNPTVQMFESKLAAMEGGEACLAFASGMAAQLAVFMALLQAGDHVVCSQGVFGSTITMLNTILNKFNISVSYVPLTHPAAWADACLPNTKLFFLETPSNPLTEVADMAAMSVIAKQYGVLLVVDNCFCTPALQQPLKQGADIVLHSATKFLDGQGRVLGGAVVASTELIKNKLLPILRTTGASLSPFNAWVLLKGMETLPIRMEKQSANALQLATWLESHPAVEKVLYPFLPSHPQYSLAKQQQIAGGAILSVVIKGATPEQQRANAWAVIDATRLISITGNLGDTRTTICHSASTTHTRIKPEERAAAGITEGMLRISVGLEHPLDIQHDLLTGLSAVIYTH
jgi:O-succinylhomoserine sulfhydrylase